jgi:membrane-bound lytic murein transglycosylase D
MKKLVGFAFLICSWLTVYSQGEIEFPEFEIPLDSIEIEPAIDPDAPVFTPVPSADYIPAFASYQLLEERFKCIEQAVPLTFNERVYAFVNYFTIKDRNYTRQMLERKNLYFPLFEKYLEKYGLPDELKYLSIIESGLNPKAISRARAGGLWQFMPATGRHFGLYQDWFIDDRMDPEKATDAACRYLKQLYGMFGDWELALAAYNTGPGNIRKAMRKSGYKNTFWEIYPNLHRETRSYVPQYAAMVYVMNFVDEHNLFTDGPDYMMASDTILVSQYVHLETFAQELGVCLEDLQKLNPGIMRNAVPASAKNYALRIPADKSSYFAENRAAILDTASKVGRTEIEMMARNDVGTIHGKDRVVYTVRSGDVLGKIAMRHGVKVTDIQRWNNMNSTTIRIGQKLTIYPRGSTAAPAPVAQAPKPTVAPVIPQTVTSGKVYTVQPGDTLWHISKKFEGLTIEKIKQLNQLKDDNIKPGQKLIIG